MKRVFSAEFIPEVVHVQNLLEQSGIACTLRNERLGGAIGEIPFLEAWPQLWVDDADETRALRMLGELAAAARAQGAPAWRCSGCGEQIEGQFSECWQCGTPREVEVRG
jgi:hypothetical protein